MSATRPLPSPDEALDLGGAPVDPAYAAVELASSDPQWWIPRVGDTPEGQGRAAAICHEIVHGDPENARRWALRFLSDAAGGAA